MMEEKYHGKSMREGGGGRFAKMEDAMARKGIKDPAALAAWVGRKKLGKKKFQKLAAAGRKRAARNKA
jgi:hypothetical protein